MKVGIIGSDGYVGSFLKHGLPKLTRKTTAFSSEAATISQPMDRSFMCEAYPRSHQALEATNETLQSYHALIFCSGYIPKMLGNLANIGAAVDSTLVNFVRVLEKLKENQLFVYMSTSAMARGVSSYDAPATEASIVDTFNLTPGVLERLHQLIQSYLDSNTFTEESRVRDLKSGLIQIIETVYPCTNNMNNNNNNNNNITSAAQQTPIDSLSLSALHASPILEAKVVAPPRLSLSCSPLQLYVLLMQMREAIAANKFFRPKTIIGLRLGTVLGLIEHKDTANRVITQCAISLSSETYYSLTLNAMSKGVLSLSNETSFSPFLCSQDLIHVIQTLIRTHVVSNPNNQSQNVSNTSSSVIDDCASSSGGHNIGNNNQSGKSKIYNLASFNATFSRMAHEIASKLHVPIQVKEKSGSVYVGFAITAGPDSLIARDYPAISFRASPSSLINDILASLPIYVGAHENFLVSATQVPLPLQQCKICQTFSTDQSFRCLLDLGTQPLANEILLTPEEVKLQSRHDLQLWLCRNCWHAQLKDVTWQVSPDRLFQHYLYASGVSSTAKFYFKWFAKKVANDCGFLLLPEKSEAKTEKKTTSLPLSSAPVVLEIASNDGSQLDEFAAIGWKTIGVDPATNLCQVATAKHHTIHNTFWSSATAEQLLQGATADLVPLFDHHETSETHRCHGLPELKAIVAQNVLAHVPDPIDFLLGCKRVMSPDTRLYVQTSQCKMFHRGEFDTIYHEHMSFFSAHSLTYAADKVGLRVLRMEETPIHGTSLLATLVLPSFAVPMEPFQSFPSFAATYSKQTNQRDVNSVFGNPPIVMTNITQSCSENTQQGESDNPQSKNLSLHAYLLQEEKKSFEDDLLFWVKYQHRTEGVVDWVSRELTTLAEQGYKRIGYGAAAKGITLMNYMIHRNRNPGLKYVIDDSPLKQGHLIPGIGIPIEPFSKFQEECTTATASTPASPFEPVSLSSSPLTPLLPPHSGSKRLCVLVLAWNLFDEICKRIYSAIVEANQPSERNPAAGGCALTSIVLIVAFPTPQLFEMNLTSGELKLLLKYDPAPLSWDRTASRQFFQPKESASPVKIHLLTHMYNEELLLPHWIRHHAPLVDSAVLVDHNSTDQSKAIWRREAPSSWTIVSSKLDSFDCFQVEAEIRNHERMVDDRTWKITLNATEFLMHEDIRHSLSVIQHNKDNKDSLSSSSSRSSLSCALKFQSLYMAGGNKESWQPNFLQAINSNLEPCASLVSSTGTHHVPSLLEQRGNFAPYHQLTCLRKMYRRFIHWQTNKAGALYNIGRHDIYAPQQDLENGWICKYLHTPWPTLRQRKIDSNSKIPPHLAARGLGYNPIEFHDNESLSFATLAEHHHALSVLKNPELTRIWLKWYPNLRPRYQLPSQTR